MIKKSQNKSAKNNARNFWCMVFSLRTLITVLATLAVLFIGMWAVCGIKKTMKHSGEYNPSMRAEKMSERMAKKLNLTAEQQTQVKSLMLAKIQQRMAMKQQMREDMKAILTPEQFAKFEKKMKHNKQN